MTSIKINLKSILKNNKPLKAIIAIALGVFLFSSPAPAYCLRPVAMAEKGTGLDFPAEASIDMMPQFEGEIMMFTTHATGEVAKAGDDVMNFLSYNSLVPAGFLTHSIREHWKVTDSSNVWNKIRAFPDISRFILTGEVVQICLFNTFNTVLIARKRFGSGPTEIHIPFDATDFRNKDIVFQRNFLKNKNNQYSKYLRNTNINYVILYDGEIIDSEIFSGRGRQAAVTLCFWSSRKRMFESIKKGYRTGSRTDIESCI